MKWILKIDSFSFFFFFFAGVSLKTQELYAIVFATRYLDIFTTFVSVYNIFMKLVFLGSSFSIVWYMRYHKAVQRTYDREQDTFRHWFLVLPCLLLALLIHEKFTFLEVCLFLFLLKKLLLSLTRLIGVSAFTIIRYCGRFRCTWRLLLYYLSLSCFKGLETLIT